MNKKNIGIISGGILALLGTGYMVMDNLGFWNVSTSDNDMQRFGSKDRKDSHQKSEVRSISRINLADGQYRDGEYVGVGVGYQLGLKVKITIENNKIKDLQIVSHNETPDFYEKAVSTVTSEIIEKQSTDVDTVSGATMSSYGIMEAVSAALANALVK